MEVQRGGKKVTKCRRLLRDAAASRQLSPHLSGLLPGCRQLGPRRRRRGLGLDHHALDSVSEDDIEEELRHLLVLGGARRLLIVPEGGREGEGKQNGLSFRVYPPLKHNHL